jgi:hypothetical protein
VEEFKYLITTVKIKISFVKNLRARGIRGKLVIIRCRSFVFQFAIQIHTTIILPVVLFGRENWSLTLCEERRLRTFENRVLRGIFGPKRNEVTSGENYIVRSLMICTDHPILCE